MKIEYVLTETVKEEIEKYQKQIEEIEKTYIEDYLKNPFQSPDFETRFRRDSRVQTLEKTIEKLYALSVGECIITAENEEDKEKIEKLKNEIDMSRPFYLGELKRW